MSMEDVKINPCGTRIKTLIGGLEGFVTGISIRQSNQLYEMSYFANGEHREIWLYPFEFEIVSKKAPVGFIKPEKYKNIQLT